MLSLGSCSRRLIIAHVIDQCSVRGIHHHKERGYLKIFLGMGMRKMLNNKHKDPKYRKLRGQKLLKIDLSGFVNEVDPRKSPLDYNEADMRRVFKRMGAKVYRPWDEKGMFSSHSNTIIDPVAKKGALQKGLDVARTLTVISDKERKAKSAVRKANELEGKAFNDDVIIRELNNIYESLFIAMNHRHLDAMHDIVTEYYYPDVHAKMTKQTVLCSIDRELKAPIIRRWRIQENDGLNFAQVTLQFNTVQRMALFDRFGRLIDGSENEARDVLDIVVFEKVLHVKQSPWRIHDIQSLTMNTRHYIQGSYLTPPKSKESEEQQKNEEKVEAARKAEISRQPGIVNRLKNVLPGMMKKPKWTF